MHKISLKDWVVLLTILPTTLIGLFIAGYFSYSRYAELNDFLEERSRSIIEPIAIASFDPLLQQDRNKLRNLISLAHRSQSSIINNIAVFTSDNQIFVTSSYHGDTNILRIKVNETLPPQTTVEEVDNYIIFRTPIINEQLIHNKNSAQQVAQETLGYIAMQIDNRKIKFNQQSQFIIAFSIVLLGSLLSAIFAIRLIKNVTRPVTSMVKAVDRIREGKLESRVSGQLIGELNFLKNGINSMAQSLGDYHDEMQRSIDQATIDLRESLEQFEIQNVELDISKRKAQDANKVKSEFLANMSHELRTPLNGVIGFTRQLLKTPMSEIQRDYLQTIERSANNLLAIINAILDFSKLDAGKMVIEKIPFSLRDSLEDAIALLAPMAHKKNLNLSLRVSQQLSDSFIGDAMRIKQILTNLANNSIKFTDKGSVNIDVALESKTDDSKLMNIKVTVTDTGIGMNSEQQRTIFEAFGQADQSVTRLYGGTGLGLVISQRLAHEMNGNIGFSSEENQGSAFWFTFTCEPNQMPAITPTSNNELKNKHILYFEPHSHTRIATSEILAQWGMQVSPINSSEQLNNMLSHENKFDYALLGHDVGPAALNDLKSLITTIKPYVPSLHIAINSNSPNLQEALIACGALSCFSKPITSAKLRKALLPQQYIAAHTVAKQSEQKEPLKVLAVDDNEANLKLIKALLLEQVTDVTVAENGAIALELCKNEKFALIYMDIQMPVMDGVSALHAIKANTFNDNTPIIAVTAHALSSEKEKLLQQGFDSYMTKPIDESMLRHTIYEYCDLQLLSSPQSQSISKEEESEAIASNPIIDWPLAIKRAGNKEVLAKEMLIGLVNSLPDTKEEIQAALTCQDATQLKVLIHKLNGACCYTGVPSLARITQQLESMLKKEENLDALEPEFLEFFEQLENVLEQGEKTIESFEQTIS